MTNYEDILLAVARIEREARMRAVQKIAAKQLGEAWVGIDDRRAEPRIEPGRRAA